jgi:hypothetical protein
MSTQKLSKARLALTFVVIFVVVFGTLSLPSFLGLESYGSPVAGAVAGVASCCFKSCCAVQTFAFVDIFLFPEFTIARLNILSPR